jgi:K+-sensing histidine kinase KdpD
VTLVVPAPEPSRRARLVGMLRSRPRPLAYTAAVLLPLLVLPLAIFAEHPHGVTAGRLFVLVVAVAAFLGGLGPALVATGISFAELTYYFTPGKRSFLITDPEDLGSLAVFLVTALVISELFSRREAAQRDAAVARERAERLQQVTAALVEAHTTQGVLDVMLEQGIAATSAARGAIALVCSEGTMLEVRAWHNYPQSMVRDFSRMPIEADLPHTEVARSGRPLFLSSRADRDKRYPPLAERHEESHALAALPLNGRSGTLGTIVLSFAENRAFASEERELLETIGRQCAQALERAQLLEKEAEARRELALQKAILEAEGEASDDGILLVSPEGRMLSFNRRFVDLWSLPPDVVASRSDAQALSAIESKLAEPQEFFDRVAELYANPDEESREEVDLIDGRILERYSAPVRSPEGELYGRVWYFRDITELRRGQEIASVLAAASDLLSSTTEVEAVLQLVVRLPIPRLLGICTLYLIDETGTPRLTAVAHWDPEQEDAVRELHSRYPAGKDGPITRVLRTKEKVLLPALDRETLQLTAHDDEHLALLQPFASRAALMVPLVAHGLTYGVLGVGAAPRRNVLSPQKQEFAEEFARRIAIALDNARLYAESERRGDAARSLEHVGDGVVLLDGEERLRYWNPAAADLLRLNGDSLGRPMTEVFEGWRELVAHLDGGGGDRRTLPLQLEGAERWISISAVRFADGSVYALRDVSEERTLEGMRADFVSTASHELRTPLTAVYGAARTLLREDVPLSDAHQRSFLTMIAGESERLARIVNDILLASSLDANTIEIETEHCDVAELVEGVVSSARMRLPDGLTLTEASPNGPLSVECDAERVRQVLVNLVDNAIKYSPDGGEIEVAFGRHGDAVRFEVRDRGLGIPAAERERIFDKFLRLDPNQRRGIGGTGLGLYICRELARRMGGRIWVDGRVGGGSVFYLELPASASSAST